MKKNKIIYSSLILMAAGFIIIIIGSGGSLKGTFSKNKNLINQKPLFFEKENITSIEVDSEIADINIYSGESDEVNAKCVKEVKFKSEVINGVLKVETSGRNHNFFNFNFSNDCEVNISINNTEFENIDIKTDVGAVYINGITSKIVNINSSVGDTKLDSSNINNLTIISSVGNVEINKGEINVIDVKNDVGDTDIKYILNLDKLKIKSNVGDVDLSELEKFNKLVLNSDIGDVNIENVYALDIYIETNTGNIDYENDNLDFKFTKSYISSDIGDKNINISKEH